MWLMRGLRSLLSDNLTVWLAAVMLCTLSAHALGQGWPAQPCSMPGFGYQPTMQDVDPGIDHGNSDATVPYQFKKQLVFIDPSSQRALSSSTRRSAIFT
jgi:hypothetical protein